MNDQDRQVIEELFARLADIERQGRPRDPEAEAFIRQRLAAQPGAPYYMAQTIVAQEEALNAAQDRIAELEQRPARGPAGVGSFLSGLFGDASRRQPQRAAVPDQPMQSPQGGRGSGFLAGAAQTAMGVAGGVLLGNLIADAFSGHRSSAADQMQPAADDYGHDAGDVSAEDVAADHDAGDVGEDMDFGADI